MTRSRISLSIDETHKVLVVRYIGELAGDEVNLNMMQQLVYVPEVWTYDAIIDMRRYGGTILSTQIEELSTHWNQLAKGRDKGDLTAIISDDPLVHARLSATQLLFPLRILSAFDNFDEGLDWIKSRRAPALTQLSA